MPPKSANRSTSGQNGKSGQGSGKPSVPSPTMSSSANGPAATTTAVVSDANAPALSPAEQQAVDDLFTTMKQTLATLGNTFDALGKQTVTVASISPRVAAARELQRTGEQLRERLKTQEARMEELKKMLSANVKEQREKWLDKKVDELVAEIVREEVPRRVSQQITLLVPSETERQLTDYKRRIIRAKYQLYNSEARRRNAFLEGHSSGDELLTPVLLPLAPGALELSKPPALLPKKFGGLVQLSAMQLSTLLREYEIEVTPAASPLSPGSARERNADQLMLFLGVPFIMPPLSATTENGPGGPKSPIISRHYTQWHGV